MSFIRLAFLAAATSASALPHRQSAEIKIRVGTTVPEADNPQTHAFKAMAEYIEFRSGGEMKVEVFYNGALGGDRELLEQVQQNTLQFTAVADGAVANFFPEIQVVAIPYLFSSSHHALTFFNTSPFFKDVKDRMEKETKLKVMLAAESGFRNITNNAKPIKTPADMAGLKMRTMESPVFMELMRSVGAAPTPIAFNETILALRQGVVDGQENAVATVRMFGVWEVQKYMSINEHIYSPALVTTSADFYNSLTDAAEADLLRRDLRLGIGLQRRLHRQLREGYRVHEVERRGDLRQHGGGEGRIQGRHAAAGAEVHRRARRAGQGRRLHRRGRRHAQAALRRPVGCEGHTGAGSRSRPFPLI